MQQSKFAIVQSRPRRFIFGLAVGFAIGGTLLALFSGTLAATWVENLILSCMTYAGFALILFGYFYKKNGQKTFATDFLLGIGIGLALAWFVGAGNGSLTLSDITF